MFINAGPFQIVIRGRSNLANAAKKYRVTYKDWMDQKIDFSDLEIAKIRLANAVISAFKLEKIDE